MLDTLTPKSEKITESFPSISCLYHTECHGVSRIFFLSRYLFYHELSNYRIFVFRDLRDNPCDWNSTIRKFVTRKKKSVTSVVKMSFPYDVHVCLYQAADNLLFVKTCCYEIHGNTPWKRRCPSWGASVPYTIQTACSTILLSAGSQSFPGHSGIW